MHNYISKYIDNLQSEGKYSFTLREIKSKFKKNINTIRMSLLRLSKKGKIVSVKKGFYVIVPPDYSKSGILSPLLFVNDMMNNVNKKYYVGLLSAAVFHGATHYQPQELYVVTVKPALRHISVKGIKINFVIKSVLPLGNIQEQKTDTGFINISEPEMTAVDLIQFEKKIGGLSRATNIINEILEKLDSKKFKKLLKCNIPIAVLQRFGYILENILKKKELADSLYKVLHKKINRIMPLDYSSGVKGFKCKNRWKIIENKNIEIEI